ncbi:MAG: hypothetical protein JWL91_2059, partial [Sphingomonas bacterium]|nr:hypothetical protein [Sphingomonas bacterium]
LLHALCQPTICGGAAHLGVGAMTRRAIGPRAILSIPDERRAEAAEPAEMGGNAWRG